MEESIKEIVSAPRVIHEAMKVFVNFQKFSESLINKLEEKTELSLVKEFLIEKEFLERECGFSRLTKRVSYIFRSNDSGRGIKISIYPEKSVKLVLCWTNNLNPKKEHKNLSFEGLLDFSEEIKIHLSPIRTED